MTSPEGMQLEAYRPQHDFLVAVDSDGCVFDNMGIKQSECFCPMMIGYFGLQPVAQAARACKVFADLYSKTRGANRHLTIVRILEELLPSHPEVRQRGFRVPDWGHYCAWVKDPQSLLSAAGLRQAIDQAQDEEARRQLTQALRWSQRVDEMVAEIVRDIPPFPGVHAALARLQDVADLMVCSSTPREALVREWREHGLDRYVTLVGSQEVGPKAEQLRLATAGKYPPGHVLMIGDAPGDARAAAQAGVLFYPIVPGDELASWRRLTEEAIDRFLGGTYAGAYEQALRAAFDAALPEAPPWQTAS